ncbi:hypothetical protein D5S17_28575 [Pseudonocardiaceae bacterium YIM PH 21723]|nr:hypothetical protein D5S17_28575 [Pseudonocardiaceae bacterium YIM PH 21723]
MAEHELRTEGAGAVRRRLVSIIATIARWIGTLAAVILTAHVVLTVGGANPENGITKWVRGWADSLVFGFQDLFLPDDARTKVLVNYGLAAIVWLIATSIVVKLIRRLG